MLSDPEVESAVLISSDEGASFEKYPINFNVLSLLFHPAQENWILAYSHDYKMWSTSRRASQKAVSAALQFAAVAGPAGPLCLSFRERSRARLDLFCCSDWSLKSCRAE
ncbi:hypothetical protein GOODEAATRI_016517 [Goodea atripinnis]|uniref:Sortilin N-terminal domain-containing protein n=1 Tax=Goodea atripinnis TaxID=208336 RepID=A0ABV0PEV5_9TELE